jgi:hypothetical protein
MSNQYNLENIVLVNRLRRLILKDFKLENEKRKLHYKKNSNNNNSLIKLKKPKITHLL